MSFFSARYRAKNAHIDRTITDGWARGYATPRNLDHIDGTKRPRGRPRKIAFEPESTTGTGTFRATISRDETEIDYVLTFKDLESDVRQGHIHLGYPQNAGNIMLWLCDSAAAPLPVSPVESTPLCVQHDPTDFRNGTVTGTLTEADVITQTANGIAGPADWAEVVALIRGGRTYVNVHTAVIPAGEIRSQIENHGNGHDDR
jgi:hypothetical protein